MNIFKSAPQNPNTINNNNNNDTSQKRSYFKSYNDKSKIKEYNMNENDFPDLIDNSSSNSSSTSTSNENNTTSEFEFEFELNYIKASTQEIVKIEVDKHELRPGWISLVYDENRKLHIDEHKTKEFQNGNNNYNGDNEGDEWFHYNAFNTFNGMIHRWEKYKEHYIQTYGEYEYEQLYEMVNYEKMKENEDDDANNEIYYDNLYDYTYDAYDPYAYDYDN